MLSVIGRRQILPPLDFEARMNDKDQDLLLLFFLILIYLEFFTLSSSS